MRSASSHVPGVRKGRLPRLAAGLLCLLLALPAGASGAETLVLNTSARAPRSRPDGSGFEDRIVAEAFRRIGASVRIVYQPPERALHNANEGLLDGDCWRVGGQAEQFPNLVAVPEPVDVVTIQVFTKSPDMSVSGWADLRPYNVAFIGGWKILEAKVQGPRSLEKVKDVDMLFTLLARDRTDAVLVDPLMGREVIRRLGLTGIRILEPPLTRQDMFIYLHKRHAALAPGLAEALRGMKRDGTFQRLVRSGLGEGAP